MRFWNNINKSAFHKNIKKYIDAPIQTLKENVGKQVADENFSTVIKNVEEKEKAQENSG